MVALVGVGSFALGRLSAQEAQNASVVAYERPQIAGEPQMAGGQVVASQKGSKYHYPWCAGAATIAPQNLIWFKDATTARSRGYTPAGNCKGLE